MYGISAERATVFSSAASDNGHVTQSPQGPVTAGRAGRLAARVRSAAQRPVLSAVSNVGDVALAAAVTAAALLTAVKGYLYVPHVANVPLTVVLPNLPGPRHSAPHLLPLRSLALIGVVATTAPLAFRRTYPISAFGVMLVAFVATKSYSTVISVAAVIFAAYCAIAYSKHRRAAWLGLLAGAVVLTAVYPEATAQIPERYTPLLVLLPTAALGYTMRTWRQRASESADRLRLAQAAHEAETRRAVETERTRIASELHDVVTHNVSVMVVQAGVSRRLLESAPGETPPGREALLARQALLAVEASGRTAMTELRHLLGLLAPAGGDAEPAAAGPDALSPQPGLDQVPALIGRVRAAGLESELSVTGTRRALPPGLDLAAYRVVQEALTNVIKHAAPARTVVQVEYHPRELRITVSDDGRRAGTDPAHDQPPGPGGRGLIGLRERIAIYRGEMDAGPRPAGGWRVSARIPLEPVADGQEQAGAQFQAASS
jgi:signal transduction histidine kinase